MEWYKLSYDKDWEDDSCHYIADNSNIYKLLGFLLDISV